MELPESMPAHGGLHLDARGNLWVADDLAGYGFGEAEEADEESETA